MATDTTSPWEATTLTRSHAARAASLARPEVAHACTVCGATFLARDPRARYCGPTCKTRAARWRRGVVRGAKGHTLSHTPKQRTPKE